MEKLKVKQFQICYARTEYLPELHQSHTSEQSSFFDHSSLGLERVNVKIMVKISSSDF